MSTTTSSSVDQLQEHHSNGGQPAKVLDRNTFGSRSHPNFSSNLSRLQEEDRAEHGGSLSNPKKPAARRYSYYAAMRRGTTQSEVAKNLGVSTVPAPAFTHSPRLPRVPSSLVTHISLTEKTREHEEEGASVDSTDESPNLSKINRASIGSEYSRFQIDFSRNASNEEYSSTSTDEEAPKTRDGIQRQVHKMIKPSQYSSSEDEFGSTSYQGIPAQSSSLDRKLSFSETDLLHATEEVSLPDHQRERTAGDSRESSSDKEQEANKKLLVRKLAIRHRKSSDHQSVSNTRKSRSYSLFVDSHTPHASELPPPLPQRNLPRPGLALAAAVVQAADFPSPPPVREKGDLFFKRYKLHNPRNAEKLKLYLKRGKYDQVERNQNNDTPLHAVVRSDRKDKIELLVVLMVYSDYGTEAIDLPAMYGNTALHIAMFKNDVACATVLLSFGADINALNDSHNTPLDVLTSNGLGDPNREMWELLMSLDAESGSGVKPKQRPARPTSFSTTFHKFQQRLKEDPNQRPQEELSSVKLANELETNMNEIFRSYESIQDADMQMALGLQQFELKGWKTTGECPLNVQIKGGSRILFLDGGGIKGLIQIEVLSMLEKRTGKQTTKLFDWIVGTSTGGIVALSLVYGKKTLAEVRQFYFKMKDEVFAKSRFGFAGNHNTTQALEDVLKETLSYEQRMSDVKEPKVLVTAVNKSTTKPNLVFFNNCFEDQYSNEYIWKVARYTSAAPMYFSELDGYIDGGILANNPSDYGLTAIQNFYQRKGSRLDISCVVSIGNGIFPAKDLGNTDVHEMLLGMKILNIQALQRRAKNLLTLLSNALVEADDVVKNCKSRCEAQNIPFHRFSPIFKTTIDPDETDDILLVQMLIRTRIQAISEWSEQFDELVEIFEQVPDKSRSEKLKQFREKQQQKKMKEKIELEVNQALTQ